MPKDYKGQLEYELGLLSLEHGLALEPEYRFHPTRRFRLDWAYPSIKVGVEFDGIMFRTVGHNSLAGILRDSEKSNHAQALGWIVLRANAKSVGDGSFIGLASDALERRLGKEPPCTSPSRTTTSRR